MTSTIRQKLSRPSQITKSRADFSRDVESQEHLALGDDDEILRGRIDALVLLEQLWIVLIESKKTTFDLELALPQTLGYMAANPKPEQPLYAMVANSSSYLFVKTLGKHYGVSDLFTTRSPYRNNLYQVLSILKHFGSLITRSLV
jgi:hypothetical protein